MGLSLGNAYGGDSRRQLQQRDRASVQLRLFGVFYNQSGGQYIIGHGGGASAQHSYCTPISWNNAKPGDLVFYPGDSHVGIVCGFDSSGNILIIHCASSSDNVVVTGKIGFTMIGRPRYFTE